MGRRDPDGAAGEDAATFDRHGLVRLLAALTWLWLRDARSSPEEFAALADWLGMSDEELLALQARVGPEPRGRGRESWFV